jgi:triphosphatase
MMPMEIEAKYIALDEEFAGLLEVNALDDYKLGDIEEQRINDEYMDTDKLDILKAGYALRIREKNGKYLLTVKGLGGSNGAIHRREEYEMEIQQNKTPHEWPDGKAREIVFSVIQSQTLRKLFVIKQLRTIRTLHQNERLMGNMALDIVDIELDDRIERIYQVEVELGQDGTLDDLMRLDKIFRDYCLCPEPRSKFEWAMELIGMKFY